MKKIALLAMASALVLAPAVQAQETAPETAPPAAAEAAAPSATFTPDEIQKFAKAAGELNKIQADASIADADKQQRMAAAVAEQGLEPDRFNQIAQAAQSDPALLQQIQEAAAATGSSQ